MLKGDNCLGSYFQKKFYYLNWSILPSGKKTGSLAAFLKVKILENRVGRFGV